MTFENPSENIRFPHLALELKEAETVDQDMRKLNKIEETEKRLHFTIVIGLFFPVTLEALFSINGHEQEETSEIVLKAGLMIFILILNYLLFEWRKHSLPPRQLDYLNWVFFSTIACYALVVLFFGFIANGNVTTINWLTWIYYPSILVGAMYIPVVSIGIMILGFAVSEFKRLSK